MPAGCQILILYDSGEDDEEVLILEQRDRFHHLREAPCGLLITLLMMMLLILGLRSILSHKVTTTIQLAQNSQNTSKPRRSHKASYIKAWTQVPSWPELT